MCGPRDLGGKGGGGSQYKEQLSKGRAAERGSPLGRQEMLQTDSRVCRPRGQLRPHWLCDCTQITQGLGSPACEVGVRASPD